LLAGLSDFSHGWASLPRFSPHGSPALLSTPFDAIGINVFLTVQVCAVAKPFNYTEEEIQRDLERFQPNPFSLLR